MVSLDCPFRQYNEIGVVRPFISGSKQIVGLVLFDVVVVGVFAEVGITLSSSSSSDEDDVSEEDSDESVSF